MPLNQSVTRPPPKGIHHFRALATKATTAAALTNQVLDLKGTHNYLGKPNVAPGGLPRPLFTGQMDDVRVWSTQHSAEEIRAGMTAKLTAQEPGLVGYWGFDDPAEPGRDPSANAHHDTLVGNAKTAQAISTGPGQPLNLTLKLEPPLALSGTVRDTDGQPLAAVMVQLLHNPDSEPATVADANEKPAPDPSPNKTATPGNGPLVLVIDDDPDMRDLTTRLLGKEGYRVTCAPNGKDGLALAKQLQPAVITLDVMMPELDGFGFIDGLRKIPGCHHVPVIVITAKDITPEDRARLNGQVTRILQKATSSHQELLAEIRSLVPIDSNFTI